MRARASVVRAGAAVLLLVLLAPGARCATTMMDLPPALQAIPMKALLDAFGTTFETPSLAAEVARFRAWAPPASDEVAVCPGLGRVMQDYPGTSDARLALYDLCSIYARKDDWTSVEAPFRYVMERYPGTSTARIAYLKLIDMYQYAGAPVGVDPIAECRAAIEAYAGTPEEGFGRMLLADMLAAKEAYEASFQEFERTIAQFPGQPYSSYARIRFGLHLVGAGQYDRALEVTEPVLADPAWSGRALYARGAARAGKGAMDAAIADYEKAARTADSVYIRADAYFALSEIYEQRGQHGRARECLEANLAISSMRRDQPQIRLSIIRQMQAAGEHLAAAQAAVALEKDMLNAPGRYGKSELSSSVWTCNEILDACEAALAKDGK